jgi:transcriptional regulator with XRE-family HTH domain
MTTLDRIGKTHWEERGIRIERARNFAGLSQAQLAAAVTDTTGRKIGRQVIYNLEKGTRSIDVDELRAIAAVLDQSEAWLDGEEGAPFNDAPIVHAVSPGWFRRPIDAFAATPILKAA